MEFENSDDIGFPIDEVFALIRDDMPALTDYLPDVDEILVLERKEEGGGVHLTNQWRASSKSVPSVVSRFVSKDMLTWKDIAFWPQGTMEARWRLEPNVGGRLFECTGTTALLPGAGPDACKLRIRGNLRVYPERVPGVPRFLAGTLRSRIEGFVVDMLLPNMQSMARGVNGYFEDKRKKQS